MKGRVADRIRGIYCRLPEGKFFNMPFGSHTDANRFLLGGIGYIDDILPKVEGSSV